MTEDPRISKIEDGILSPRLRIGTLELRPFSLATFVLLRRAKNKLVTGGLTTRHDGSEEVIDFNDPENILDVLQFIYIHSAPISEVLKVWKDAAALEQAVLVHTSAITMPELTAAAREITQEMKAAALAVTDTPPTGEEHPDPNAHGPRG